MAASQPNKLLTLLFVLEKDKVLLGLKKRGFGVGKWNGFGGKLQENESIEDAAKRETKEECGLVVSDLDEVGVIIFDMGPGYPDQLLEVHVFRTYSYTGTLVESEEMKPQWFKYCEIPYDSMWPDDEAWYPLMLNKKYFDGFVKFDENEKIIEHNFEEKEKPSPPQK